MASGLSAIANAVSGGDGGAIQVGQIGAATDTQFPEWDGREYSLQMWIANATAMKDVHHTSDKHAITYARIKLQNGFKIFTLKMRRNSLKPGGSLQIGCLAMWDLLTGS